MVKTDTKFIFTLAKLTKTWRKGKPLMTVEFSLFPNDLELCVVKTSQSSLQVKKPWRTLSGRTQSLLSTIEPHQEVKKTQSCRMDQINFERGGKDTSQFTAHSTSLLLIQKLKSMEFL